MFRCIPARLSHVYMGVETVVSILALLGFLAAIGWALHTRFRPFKPKEEDESPPSLASLLEEEVDPALAEEPRTFRRQHVLQTAVYALASAVILVSFLITFLSEGWSLVSLLLAAAELLLLFTHGTPLLVSITRSLTVSAQGIETQSLFRRRSIEWWEVQRLLVAEDLSRFRAEGIRSRLTSDSAAFPAPVKLAVFRLLRAHLARSQRELAAWPQAVPLVRFLKANALSLGVFVAAMIATALAGEHILPEGNVLGLRCAYASRYLREKYELPDRHGCVILRVNPGTGADKAGLREGDLIVALEDVPITSGPQFTEYWESLDKRKQKFTVVRSGSVDEVNVQVTLGAHGRLPEYDPNDPYFFYLRARSVEFSSEAIVDFSKAIELAPEFDLAYVYRASLYIDANVPDLAVADLDRALELDPGLTEAYRERSRLGLLTSDYDSVDGNAKRAIDLDRCAGGFEVYNFDCYVNYQLLSRAYGDRADPEGLRQGVEHAKTSISFYPERPRSYYLAAYYLSALEQMEEAKDYAARYLEVSKDYAEPGNLIDWAQRVVSGSGFPDDAPVVGSDNEVEPSALFVESDDDDIDPDGEPSLSLVAFSDQRTIDAPDGAFYLTPDRQYLWAYFEFDNAANVRSLYWEWTQNSFVHQANDEFWPRMNKGWAWLRLENRFVGEISENTLMLRFDDKVVANTEFHLREDPYIGPLTFYSDAGATQPLLLYSGNPNQIYATGQYIGPPNATVVWFAEKHGAGIAEGLIEVAESGVFTIPIGFASGATPGIIDVRVYLDGVLARSAAVAVAPTEITAVPPFSRFDIGLEPDSQGNIVRPTKEVSRNTGGFRYLISGIQISTNSSLTIRWLHNGAPLGFAPEIITADTTGLNSGVSGEDGYLKPGEYMVVVSLDTQPVYADVVVVT